jgi:S1-C subfamily serine protease
MKHSSQPGPRRFLRVCFIGVLVGLALAVALSGCSLPGPFASRSTTTAAPVIGPPVTSATTTTERPVTTVRSTTTTASPQRTSTTLAGTTTTIVHYSTGDPKAVAKKLKPSVVGVTAVVATTKTQIFQSIGTGVVYSATASSGYIITNNHVIIRDDGTPAKRIRVTLPSGSIVSATLVGRDPTTDIAVLKVKGRGLKAPVFRTDMSQLLPGEFMVAVGNAKVLVHPVTSGEVTEVLTNIEYPGLSGVDEVIETTVPLAHGNSGGPLADALAQVVGINMAELLSGEGGISLPADLVVEVVKRLIASA